jgi:hypothetical protein
MQHSNAASYHFQRSITTFSTQHIMQHRAARRSTMQHDATSPVLRQNVLACIAAQHNAAQRKIQCFCAASNATQCSTMLHSRNWGMQHRQIAMLRRTQHNAAPTQHRRSIVFYQRSIVKQSNAA